MGPALAGHMQRQRKLAHAGHDVFDYIGDDIRLAEDSGCHHGATRGVVGDRLSTQSKGLGAKRLVPEHDHGVVQVVVPGQEIEGRIDETDAEFIGRKLVEEGQELAWITSLNGHGGIHCGRASHRGQLDPLARLRLSGSAGTLGRSKDSGTRPALRTGARSAAAIGTEMRYPWPRWHPELEQLLDGGW